MACTSSARFDDGGFRRLSWALEDQDIDLVVVPPARGCSPARLPVSLLHVEDLTKWPPGQSGGARRR
jgi:hypothetical protein